MPLDHGAEIDIRGPEIDGDHAVEVDVVLCTFVAFDEPLLGAACEISVQEVLQHILDSLQQVIIPEFDKLIPNR
jgi:hypothetical protein